MFTGIVQEIGVIKQISYGSSSMRLIIESQKIIIGMSLGDSISVNGTCLTVTHFTKNTFSVDIMPETFNTTSLKYCKEQSLVNLEPALTINTKLGGHFVSGHVDGVGVIIRKKPQENAIYYDIKLQDIKMLKYCIHHGSIAIDGVSLTIFELTHDTFTISLIPHTAKNTVLGFKDIGDIVNLEYDMLAKFTSRLLEFKSDSIPESKLNSSFLQQHGFI